MGRTEKTFPLLLYPIFAVETHLFSKPLLNNGCRIFAYLAVIVQQRVYMPQYFNGIYFPEILSLLEQDINCYYGYLVYFLLFVTCLIKPRHISVTLLQG